MKKVFVATVLLLGLGFGQETLSETYSGCNGGTAFDTDMSCDEAARKGIIAKSECARMRKKGLNTGRGGNLSSPQQFQKKCLCEGKGQYLRENKQECKNYSVPVCPSNKDTDGSSCGCQESQRDKWSCACSEYCNRDPECDRTSQRKKDFQQDCCCEDADQDSECCALFSSYGGEDYSGAKWVSKSANPPADGSPDKNGKCCKADEINQTEECCEKGNVSTEVCCKKERREWNAADNECCEENKVVSNGHCCEKGNEWIDAVGECCKDGQYCEDTNQCGECQKCKPLVDENGNPVLGADGLQLQGEWCEECD